MIPDNTPNSMIRRNDSAQSIVRRLLVKINGKFMRKLKSKFGIALLTFFIGTVLSLVSFQPESQPAQSLKISPPSVLEIGTPKLIVASNNIQVNDESSRPVRYVKGGGELCEKYLFKKIAKEKTKDSRTVKLKAFDTDEDNLSPELKDWLQTIHLEMLVVFELRQKDKKVLIFRANVAGATGIAANFTNWFIQFENRSINFRSLSEEPKLIFLNKDGSLNYYSVDYGDKFLEKRDWDNLTLNLLRYKINPNGKSELLSEEYNLMCE
jgi:hypothetical protein